MKDFSRLTVVLFAATIAGATAAGGMEEHRFGAVRFDELEVRDAGAGKPLAWEGDAWYGGDFNKVWFKTEGERLNGKTETAEAELYWSRAIAPFWDLQVGARREFQPDKPSRNWAAVAVQGLAPYFFETNATLYVGEAGRTNLRLESEYELLLTQRLILSPDIEVNFHGKEDHDRGIGDGLTELELGLRLRYEFSRKFAPYVGVNWERLYGETADLADARGEDIEHTQAVVGIRAWF